MIEEGSDFPLALQLARAWAELPAEHLQVALAALEPQLVREHDLSMLGHRQSELEATRRHRLAFYGLLIGLAVAVASLGGAIYFGVSRNFIAMGLMLGPSVFVMIKTFVLRRSDSGDVPAIASLLRPTR